MRRVQPELEALIWKELKERKLAYPSLAAVMLILGAASVAVVYALPEILPEELRGMIPELGAEDAIADYFENTAQIALLLIAVVTSTSMAKEVEKGTLELLLAHPVRRELVALAKLTSSLAASLGSLALASLATWAYSRILGPYPLAKVLKAALLMSASIAYTCASSALLGSLFRAQLSAGASAAALHIASLVAQGLASGHWVAKLLPHYSTQMALAAVTKEISLKAALTPLAYATLLALAALVTYARRK
ncbi:MAG: hypothetical protein DRN96_08805 [Thermoproteota archaeon]|nr:MAG: hypothetical protein DRN96_08805 [Candidatus Korarchaeota archaeon]